MVWKRTASSPSSASPSFSCCQSCGWRNLLLALVNLPFARAGGVLAVFGTGGYPTLGSTIGFVTVFGITVRNSILIISHYEHLIEVEGLSWGLQQRSGELAIGWRPYS